MEEGGTGGGKVVNELALGRFRLIWSRLRNGRRWMTRLRYLSMVIYDYGEVWHDVNDH